MGWRRVLVVEDDEAIRDSLAMVLREEGFLVATACNGREALAWLRAHPDEVGVVLLDLMMPIMDGRAFLRVKAEDPLIAGVPVVVISAGRDVETVRQAHGVRECLPKPICMERLLKIVADCRGPFARP